MIRMVDRVLPLEYVSGDEPVSGRLLSWWQAYSNTNIAQFYQTEHHGCIAVMDSQAIVCAAPIDREEICVFLQMQPSVCKVYSTIPELFDGKAMHFTAMRAVHSPCEAVIQVPRLQELYTFLQPFFEDLPPFEPWYLDVSYRTRHGLCRQTSITENGKIVSSAMTVAEWKNGALIGAVATDPAFRSRGFAGRCVNALTASLQAEGKTVWICPYNEPAHRLYQSLGFVDNGNVTVLERT